MQQSNAPRHAFMTKMAQHVSSSKGDTKNQTVADPVKAQTRSIAWVSDQRLFQTNKQSTVKKAQITPFFHCRFTQTDSSFLDIAAKRHGPEGPEGPDPGKPAPSHLKE